MMKAGADVAVVSWWGRPDKNYTTDTQGVSTDVIIPALLRIADEENYIKIAFHLEPYPSRSAESVREDIEYIIDNYGHFKSFYRAEDGRPLFYIYDSYHISSDDWKNILHKDGASTLRATKLDSWFIGLWLDRKDGAELQAAGFDGVYTYFASDGFSFGSSTHNWDQMCSFCRKESLTCILSVGPGYNDTLIRPWNHQNSKSRRCGRTWASVALNCDLRTITMPALLIFDCFFFLTAMENILSTCFSVL